MLISANDRTSELSCRFKNLDFLSDMPVLETQHRELACETIDIRDLRSMSVSKERGLISNRCSDQNGNSPQLKLTASGYGVERLGDERARSRTLARKLLQNNTGSKSATFLKKNQCHVRQDLISHMRESGTVK